MSWLWRRDSSSTASFEKALSKLSAQIAAVNVSLDKTRSQARRAKALWTLYTTLTYLIYTLIITLVLGPHKWSIPHYGGLVGGPLIIYTIRKALTLFFDWRVNRQQSHLEDLQKQRASKIADLKKATKYDSTQELLQKYGGAPPQERQQEKPQQGTKRKIAPPQQQPQRTGIAPPPTANIPGRNANVSPPQRRPQTPMSSQTHADQQSGPPPLSPDSMSRSPYPMSPDSPGESFAPNAFPMPPPQAPPAYTQPSAPHWYDRILDVLLGEDETAAKNRLALICQNCRLVNGQAPPGAQTLEDVGRWRCSACGSWNGTERRDTIKEIKKAVGLGDEDWEKVPKGQEAGDAEPNDAEVVLDEKPGSSAREDDNPSGVTKRVTRSTKEDDLASLQ